MNNNPKKARLQNEISRFRRELKSRVKRKSNSVLTVVKDQAKEDINAVETFVFRYVDVDSLTDKIASVNDTQDTVDSDDK